MTGGRKKETSCGSAIHECFNCSDFLTPHRPPVSEPLLTRRLLESSALSVFFLPPFLRDVSWKFNDEGLLVLFLRMPLFLVRGDLTRRWATKCKILGTLSFQCQARVDTHEDRRLRTDVSRSTDCENIFMSVGI